jgi:hypothetical protein
MSKHASRSVAPPIPPTANDCGVDPSMSAKLQRLRGLLNLYCRAVGWTIHHASDWRLGENPSAFRLNQEELALVGMERVADVWFTCWRETSVSGRAMKRGNVSVSGRIDLSEIAMNIDPEEAGLSIEECERRVSVRSRSHSADGTEVIFSGDDRITSVTFIDPETDDRPSLDWQVRIPFEVISPALRHASNATETFFDSCNIAWEGPPFFLGFERGAELLPYMARKGIEAAEVLADLDQHRRQHVRNVERALREAREREESLATDSTKMKSKRGRKAKSDPKRDAKLVADWNAASANGVYKPAFAKSRGLALRDLVRAQSRERARKSRAHE